MPSFWVSVLARYLSLEMDWSVKWKKRSLRGGSSNRTMNSSGSAKGRSTGSASGTAGKRLSITGGWEMCAGAALVRAISAHELKKCLGADGVVEGAGEEEAVFELGELHGEQGEALAVVVDGSVEQEEGVGDVRRHIVGADVGNREVVCRCMDELGAGDVAVDEQGNGGRGGARAGDEAASDCLEDGEGARRGSRYYGVRLVGEEEDVLYVVEGEVGEVPWREGKKWVVFHGRAWVDGGRGDDADGLGRHGWS